MNEISAKNKQNFYSGFYCSCLWCSPNFNKLSYQLRIINIFDAGLVGPVGPAGPLSPGEGGPKGRGRGRGIDFPLRVLVSSDMVGAIIGRGGATIRNITQQSRARVDVHRWGFFL